MNVKEIITMPDGYKQIQTLPEDPVGTVVYGFATPFSQNIITVFPFPLESAMLFGDAQHVINGIHHSLGENQALIEVNTGKTTFGRPYIYSIIKTAQEPSGVQYFMLFQEKIGNEVVCVKAFFQEYGTTGIRDNEVFSAMLSQGVLTVDEKDKWWRDPYDETLKRPYLMNLSEMEQFDEYFPDHPLSQARTLIKHFIVQ